MPECRMMKKLVHCAAPFIECFDQQHEFLGRIISIAAGHVCREGIVEKINQMFHQSLKFFSKIISGN